MQQAPDRELEQIARELERIDGALRRLRLVCDPDQLAAEIEVDELLDQRVLLQRRRDRLLD